MKRIFVVLAVLQLAVTVVHALDAPTIISAEALSAKSIMLSWRNNSTAYTGILVLRNVDGSEGFEILAETEGNTSTYLDDSLMSNTPYTYALVAVAGADTSDTSNMLTGSAVNMCTATLESCLENEQASILKPGITWNNDSKHIAVTGGNR
ncbi:MAG: fibronectin type III domain-containing protein [Chitinispirillaceae bacterium]|nr:fibronectin type III domain-containing protein [Chitinispirillaceae bacterium]